MCKLNAKSRAKFANVNAPFKVHLHFRNFVGDVDGDGDGEGECDGCDNVRQTLKVISTLAQVGDGDGEGDGEGQGDGDVDGDGVALALALALAVR